MKIYVVSCLEYGAGAEAVFSDKERAQALVDRLELVGDYEVRPVVVDEWPDHVNE